MRSRQQVKTPEHSNDYGTPPVVGGRIDLPDWEEYLHYMYLPVRMPGDGSVRLPQRLEFARRTVTVAIWDHIMRGGAFEDCHVYLTVRRGWASPGNPLNRPGWHTDGFGGTDINYVWADRYPTLFAEQCFTGISEDHQLSVDQFTDQLDPERIVTYPDRTLLRLDPSVVHSVPEIPAPGGTRSFLKVSFSPDRYDLAGNAHNYLFDYDWPMYSREVVRNDPSRANTDSGGTRLDGHGQGSRRPGIPAEREKIPAAPSSSGSIDASSCSDPHCTECGPTAPGGGDHE